MVSTLARHAGQWLTTHAPTTWHWRGRPVRVVAFAFDEVADGGDDELVRHAEGGAGLGFVFGREELKIDPVTQGSALFRCPAKTDDFIFQCSADGNHRFTVAGGLQDHLPQFRVVRNQVDVGATGGNHDRLVECLADHGGGDAVRVEIMGVDKVEVVAAGDEALCGGKTGARQGIGRCVHADLG